MAASAEATIAVSRRTVRASRLELLLIGIAALALASASLFTYWNIVEDREVTRATLFKVNESLAITIEQHIDETLRDARNAVYSAAVLIENSAGFRRLSPLQWHRELNRELVDSTSIARLVAADATGRIIASSADFPMASQSLADTENFKWHLAHPGDAGMYLGVSRRSAVSGKWVLPYSRAIVIGGALAGVVVAEIDVEHIHALYTNLTGNFPALIVVFNMDGIRLLNFPFAETMIGKPISPRIRMAVIAQGNASVEFTPDATGQPTLFSYRILQPYRLVTAIGIEKQGAMAPWEARARQRITVVGSGSLLFLALVALLLSYLRKLARSEAQLRSSEAQVRSISDNLPNGVVYQVERNPDGSVRFVYLSAGIERYTGLNAADIIKDPQLMYDLIVEEDLAALRAAERKAAGSMANFEIEVRLRRRDGELRWIHLRSAPRALPDGRTLWDGIQMDVTESRLAAEALRIRQARIESLFRSAPVGIAELYDREFTVVNECFCELLGYAADELLGKNTRMLYASDEDWHAMRRRYRELIPLHGVATFEARYRRKDGGMIDVLFSGSSVMPDDPEHLWATVTIMDITETKAAQRRLEEAYAKLKTLSGMLLDAQETERRNISGELHDEIGQALTAVKMQLHRMRGRIEAGTATAADVAAPMEIADIALAQVRNLSVNLRPPQLDLMGLEAALKWLLQRQAEPGGMKVHFSASLGSGTRTPQSDITCFRIVQEALTNAMRHSGAKNLWVDVAETSGSIELGIRDDGRGFDLEAARHRAARGGSIGLLSMEERVTLMGGSFEIVSRPDAGTRIHATIPA